MEKLIADNKKAYFDYFILDKFLAGVVLEGQEVKSVRAGKVNLRDAIAIARKAAKIPLAFEFDEDAADVDGNGKANLRDAILVARYAAHMINSFPRV